jgi:hypothetical protein
MVWNWVLLFDVVIAVLLCATIFFAARLSLHLKVFRQSRHEIQGLMTELSKHIETADDAIHNLRDTAAISGRDLQKKLTEAQALTEELELMTQSANRLASRLEVLADQTSGKNSSKNAYALQDEDDVQDSSGLDKTNKRPAAKKAVSKTKIKKKKSPFSFAIRDPDYATGNDGLDANDFFADEEEDQNEKEPLSRAEQELFDALNQRRHKADGVS